MLIECEFIINNNVKSKEIWIQVAVLFFPSAGNLSATCQLRGLYNKWLRANIPLHGPLASISK